MALDAMTKTKELEIYLGVVTGEARVLERLYRIISGDPSRGSLALEGENAPPVGSAVQVRSVYHFLHSSVSQLTRSVPQMFYASSSENPDVQERDVCRTNAHTERDVRPAPSLSFTAVSPDTTTDATHDALRVALHEGDGVVVLDRFHAASENGIVIGRGREEMWRCGLGGTTARVQWR